MRNFSMLKDAYWFKVEPYTAAGTSTLTTTVVDMAGYDSVMFLASLGVVTDASVPALTVLGNTTNSASGGTALADATYTASTSSDFNIAVEVHVPSTYRYVYATLARATQNAVVDCIWAVKFNAREVPVTQTAAANGIAASAIGYPLE